MDYYASMDSPLGKLLLVSDGTALTGLYINREAPFESPELPLFRKTAAWLEAYFCGQPGNIDFPLEVDGTAFQRQVWRLLLQIPFGETRTYGQLARELAQLMGKVKMSAQAVGQAVGKNPISIIIPCHRVVGTKGQLTGYAGGIDKKIWLLRHEGRQGLEKSSMRFAKFENIETQRLLLRPIVMEDVLEYYERLYGDGDVCRYMLFDPHQDISESMASIEKTLARYEAGGCYRWGIALQEDNSLIGVIELLRFDEEAGSCSFAYMLGCDYWNRGYGTEALSAVIRFAFEKMDVERILVDHMSPNAASGAVMRKAGMTHIGTEPGKYEKHGQVFDAEVYEIRNNVRKAMTVNDYQKLAMKSLNPALTRKDVLINGVMGLCGESGEAIDIVKKHLHQGHDLDKKKLAGELGDIAWYLAETAWALDIPLEEIFRGNLDKLKRRYPEGFAADRSRNR